MKVAIDASPLMINRYSGLAEVVHNLLLNLPSGDNKSDFALYMNYFRTADSEGGICYPGKKNIFLLNDIVLNMCISTHGILCTRLEV